MNSLQLRPNRWLILPIGVALLGLTLSPPVALAADTATKEKVDINTASEKELQELPGIGEATAKKIVAGRPYKSIAAGLSKAGVNDAEIAKLKGLVTIAEPKAAEKSTEKKPEKADDKGKASENGKMNGSKMADSGKSAEKSTEKGAAAKMDGKMDAKTGKDAMTKSTEKSTDKMTDKSTDKKDKTATTDKMTGPKIDLNTASDKELEQLPGVGDATAKKIIAGRPYKSVEGLSKAGVNDAEIAKLKSLVMVSEAKAPAKMDSKMADADAKSGGKMADSKMDSTAGKKTADSKMADSKSADSRKAAMKEKEKTSEPTTPPPTDKEIKDATAKKLVWGNLNSKVFHESGDRWYGKTHHGKFMTEDEAKKEGYTKAHMNENSDETKDSKSK